MLATKIPTVAAAPPLKNFGTGPTEKSPAPPVANMT